MMRAQNCVDIIKAREWRAVHNLDTDVNVDAHGLSVDSILVRCFVVVLLVIYMIVVTLDTREPRTVASSSCASSLGAYASG